MVNDESFIIYPVSKRENKIRKNELYMLFDIQARCQGQRVEYVPRKNAPDDDGKSKRGKSASSKRSKSASSKRSKSAKSKKGGKKSGKKKKK